MKWQADHSTFFRRTAHHNSTRVLYINHFSQNPMKYRALSLKLNSMKPSTDHSEDEADTTSRCYTWAYCAVYKREERKSSIPSLPRAHQRRCCLPAVPEMKSFCGGTKMDDLQGPEVETIPLLVPFHPLTLYECAAKESLVRVYKLYSGSVISSLNNHHFL